MNTYTYNKGKLDKNSYDEAKSNYDKFIAKLNEGDWKYFATISLEDIEEQIKNAKNTDSSNLNTLYTKKQILEWRIDKNIAYGSDALNNRLENYENASYYIESYKEQKNPSYSEKIEYYNYICYS